MRHCLPLLLLLAALLPACLGGNDRAGQERAPALEPYGRTVRVGYIANGLPAGIGFVLEEGQLFASQRLPVVFQRYAGPEGLRRALLTSELDVAVALPLLSAAKLLEEDTHVVVVAGLQLAEEQVMVPLTSTIQSVADLRGKLVGTPGPGSSGDLLFWSVLSHGYGFGPADLRTHVATETQLVILIESGAVDAVVLRGLTVAGLPDPSRYRIVSDLPAEWRAATQLDAPPIVATVTMRRGFLDGYPDEAARALAGIILAVRWGRQHPAEVAQLMTRHLRMTQANAHNYARRWPQMWAAVMDDAAVAAMQLSLERLRSQGLIRQPVPETLFDRALFTRASHYAR
ncbi:MAG: MqnA/MqnD/SBP family protein [Chloroflexota bacterium]|nr:ABC transporter substrate-binding protein [Dehalococcoidia bacterium]MDW8253791.1 MqnA/MqnD/SBP family protein [Chloroflexota bacterium]